MKKVIKSINNYTVEVLLFFVYFVAIGVARIIYHFQNVKPDGLGSFKVTKQRYTKAYFLSPY